MASTKARLLKHDFLVHGAPFPTKNEEKKSGERIHEQSASPKPHPSKPHPHYSMPQAKTEVALQFSECLAAEIALQHWLFCSADVIMTKSCAASSEKLQCNIESLKLRCRKVALSCCFPADFKLPRLGTHV